ncbi:Palmitoyltransferase [Coniochaeta pulveracea]|uniref:Palmitoyltransferase PFA4 n=1 Tax=Coniochaeta pulveracea TaxID=177199 RepID=A0A420YKD1_9PEZI|nr:Palmitoyltransferase [Coniochaeta pulveracea]
MASIQTGPSARGLQVLAIPAVCLLILFLGHYSQYLFATAQNLGAGPLSTTQSVIFNTLLLCLWWTYYKACSVNPGVYPPIAASTPASSSTGLPPRWCKKCNAPKPPRAHHCRHCRRCVPKMDHHCPWTGNCVSLQTFPYFLRFLVYANLALAMLHYLVFLRARVLWADRYLPSYLGPSLSALITITVIELLASGTSLALAILLTTTLKSWFLNTTMIEGWEIERHETVVDRYSDEAYNPDDIIVQHIEFPYDLGFWDNMSQAMGTSNPLAWFWPFAGGPTVDPSGKGTGWEWEENGFNPRKGMWPPVDPDKVRRGKVGWPGQRSNMKMPESMTAEEMKRAFLQRQQEDFARRNGGDRFASGIIAELEEDEDLGHVEGYDFREDESEEEGMDGEPGWTNSDGDRLRDYGVDEDVDDEDYVQVDGGYDEDIPIAELLRRRRGYGEVR